MNKVRIITPVYNDWTSFRALLVALDAAAATLPFKIFVSAVDDGSTELSGYAVGEFDGLANLQGVEVLHLAVNLGHQRAIATGLCSAVEDDDSDAVLMMDADGEDPPASLGELTRTVGARTDFCMVAQRRRRVETLPFKVCYLLYKGFFRALTGTAVNFGNFSILSMGYARRLVMVSDLWNNLPAALLRSRLPIQAVPIDRGKRYAGRSKMDFTALIAHGLSGISVYAETIFVRLLVLAMLLVIFSVFFVAGVLYLRLFVPAHATPGWATTITFGLAILVVQVLSTALCAMLMLFNNRVQRLTIPRLDYKPYIASRELLAGSRFGDAVEQP